MKVLFLCQRVPNPPDRGDRITTHNFIRHYLDDGNEVRIGCFSEDSRDLPAARELEAKGIEIYAPQINRGLRKISCLRGLCNGSPLTLPFFSDRRLRGRIDDWMRDDPPDLIHVYSSSMAQYVLHHQGPLRIMQFAELDADKWRQYAARRKGFARWVYAREARLLLELEARVARAFDVSLVVSEVERELFETVIPDVKPVVLPNGVVVEHFHSAGEENRDAQTLIFTGVMDYEPNTEGLLWFVRECWPEIRREFRAAKLLVVGIRPIKKIRALDGEPGIEVTGRVPQTPPFFDRAALAIAPIHLARGIQNKVLEAMSMGLAVVASPQAAQGVVGDAPGLLVRDGAAQTTDCVLELLRSPERARKLGEQAAEFVRREYRWQAMFDRLDSVVQSLSEQRLGAER